MVRIRKTVNYPRNKNKTTWKVGIYIRLSKEDGNSVSLSVENQLARLKKYTQDRPEEYILVDTYIDDGRSGTHIDTRKDFVRMLEDLETGKIEGFIVKDLSRFGRNVVDTQSLLQDFVRHGVRCVTLDKPVIDTYLRPEEVNGVEVTSKNAYNQTFCAETSQKVRDSFYSSQEEGKFISAFAPYGYLKDVEDRHHFVVDKEASKVVKDIFHWYVYEHMSLGGIRRKLNELGIPNPSMHKKKIGLNYYNPMSRGTGLWDSTTIRNLLRHPCYTGKMVGNRFTSIDYIENKAYATSPNEWKIVPDMHEIIVDQKTWDLAQEFLKRNTRQSPKEQKLSMFAGYLRCADCGASMTKTTSRNLTYYYCSTHKRKSKTACSAHCINETALSKAVLASIQLQIGLVVSTEDVLEQINNSPVTSTKSTRIENLLTERKKELEKANSISDDLYYDWKNGDITPDQYRRIKRKQDEFIERIEKALDELNTERQNMITNMNRDNPYVKNFLEYRNIKELNRQIIVDLVDRIDIQEDKEIAITFKHQDQYKLLLEYIENNKNCLSLKP